MQSRRCNPRHSISIGNRNLSRHLQRLNVSAKVGDGFDGDDKAEHSEGRNPRACFEMKDLLLFMSN